MSEFKFIHAREAQAMTLKAREGWSALEEQAMKDMRQRIEDASAKGRDFLLMTGINEGHDGPMYDKGFNKMVFTPRMKKMLEEQGYEVTFPHVSQRELAPDYKDVTLRISWRA